MTLKLYFLLLPSRLLEKSFELKTQAYEKQIESLREEIKALKDERSQLHHQLEEGRVASDSLKGEVARLSKQAKVCAAFEILQWMLLIYTETVEMPQIRGGGSLDGLFFC